MSAELEAFKCLKLDLSFQPIQVIDSTEALVLLLTNRAIALEFHEREVSSQRHTFQLPSVIYVKKNVFAYRSALPVCKKNLYSRDQGICQYCGKHLPWEEATLDHVIPRSQGGNWNWDNVALACQPCNNGKGPRTPKQAGVKLLNKPKDFTYSDLVRVEEFEHLWKNYL